MIIIHAPKPLFVWDCLEESPSLQTIKDLLAALPDGKLLNSLRTARGKGRDDYPVSVLWGVVVLRAALRHSTTEAVLGELRRNEGLRRIIGIESESGVPNKWNMSRFEEVLDQEPHRTLLKYVFDVLIQRLSTAVADLRTDTAGDATALSARRKDTLSCEFPLRDLDQQPEGNIRTWQCEANRDTWCSTPELRQPTKYPLGKLDPVIKLFEGILAASAISLTDPAAKSAPGP